MVDWRNAIGDLFPTKTSQDEERAPQHAGVVEGVVTYFRDVVEPALNEVQAELEKHPNCAVDTSTDTTSREHCGSSLTVRCTGMPAFEMHIRADVFPNRVDLFAKQLGHDRSKGRYSRETPMTSASIGTELSAYNKDQVVRFVVDQLRERMKGR